MADVGGKILGQREHPVPAGTLTTRAEVEAAIERLGPLPHLVETQGWMGGGGK
jgi:hypothetical protein